MTPDQTAPIDVPNAGALERLYRDHLQQLDAWLTDSVERAAKHGVHARGVIFHAGRPSFYHRDDRFVVFRSTAHFRRWAPPLGGPEHVVAARPGERTIVVRVTPPDFWYDTSPPEPSHWEASVELHEVASFAAAVDALRGAVGSLDGWAYFGDSAAAAAELGIDAAMIEPEALCLPLDWHRATKTAYEVALSREACRAAAAGHLAARAQLEAGSSELDTHLAYLAAARCVEEELPFDSIIAQDEKSAILHYQRKRRDGGEKARVLLVDSGADHYGYASDITRTWVRAEGSAAGATVPATFRSLAAAVDAMERRLVAMVGPGRSYVEIHLECHRQIADILHAHRILSCSPEEALEKRLTRTFMPHGVGHLLGLQVHDVGGHQSAPDGGETLPPDDHVLRNTRTLEPGHLVTIEPGLYFIPMLLDEQRSGADAELFDWALIDELIPCGGIRIEDDVLCTEHGFDDLSRGYFESVED